MKRSAQRVKPEDERLIPLVFDENLGSRRVREALTTDGRYCAFTQYFHKGMKDPDLIAKAGELGVCVLTCDRGFYRLSVRVPEIKRHNARAIFIDKFGNASNEERIDVLTRAYPALRRFVQRTPAPFSAKYNPNTKTIEKAKFSDD